MTTSTGYFCGLDLGQARDYTALAILERHGYGEEAEFHARHLHRYELGTPYPAIVGDVALLLTRAPLNSTACALAIDGTGVGRPVVDLFRAMEMRAEMTAICITGGAEVTSLGGMLGVPKRDLVGCVQVALQSSTLKIAASLPLAETLTAELSNFQVKITDAAHDVYGAWREGTHDDLVLAVAMALWLGRRPEPAEQAQSYSFNFNR